jgi:anaerobic magnesium-protoporphyrin IX monomethyl ester cyclase
MKVLLAFPPSWHPLMPHLALPSLTAYLCAQGVEVAQRDLNIEVYDAILSQRYLDPIVRRLQRSGRRRGEQINAPPDLVAWGQANGPAIAAKVGRAKRIARSERFYEPGGVDAFATINDALELASIPHYPTSIDLTGYSSAYPQDISRAILAAVRDPDRNLFYRVFERMVPSLLAEEPDIVGISITSARQVIAGFTLAHLIRQAGSDAHITLGGKMITCWRDQLVDVPALFDLVDSAVIYAGERALMRLVETLDAGGDISSVPNAIYRDDDCVVKTEVEPALPIDDLPIPDFDGFPLDKYLVPDRVLPISASRGCYWHRCAFCNVGHGESATYEERQAARVLAELRHQAERWDASRFFFCDEAVSPRMLKALSRLIIEGGDRFRWTIAARFERSYTGETLQQMAQAGCRMIMYGLESGSQTILDRMDKGTNLEVAARVLRDGAKAGIWNHLFFFFGFPGETLENAQETVDFVYSQRDTVHSVCTGTFLLEPYSKVEANPAAFDIASVDRLPGRDLAYYVEYEAGLGLTPLQAEQIEQVFVDSLPFKSRAQIYFHDIYRFLYACTLDSLPLLLQEEQSAA